MESMNPLLSVRLMVYNNLPYIKKALDSVLIQKTTFNFEIVIGDDFSTDGTLEILKEYAAKYPKKIVLLDRPIGGQYYKDRLRLGRIYNWTNIVDNCKGKYIAILDGDDYWLDPLKLQKQVDFLEENQDYCICFGKLELIKDGKFIRITNGDTPVDTDFDYLLAKTFYMHSSSIVFNKSFLPPWKDWLYKNFSMDIAVQSMLSMNGAKIRMLDEIIAAYRIHDDSVMSTFSKKYVDGLKRNQILIENLYNIVPSAKKSIVERRLSILNNSINLDYLQNKVNRSLLDRLTEVFLRISIKLNKYKLERLKDNYK